MCMFFTFLLYCRMVMTHQGGGIGFGSSSGSRSSDADLHELITVEVSRVIVEDIFGKFGKINVDFVAMMDKRIRTLRTDLAVRQTKAPISLSMNFALVGLLSFSGRKSPFSV